MGLQQMATRIDEVARELEELRRRGYGEYVNIAGARLRYLAMGAGSPLLLIHGLGGFLEMWWHNIFPLSHRHRVFAVDMPGHGLSDSPANCYSVTHCTDYLLRIIDALELKSVTLVGHSLGGAVSINAAIISPERVANLVLVDSAGLTDKVPVAYRMTTVPFFGEVALKLAWKIVSERGIKRLFRDSTLVSKETLATVSAIALRPNINQAIIRILRYNMGLIRSNRDSLVTQKLPLVKARTLFIHGAQDRVFPLNNVRNAYNSTPNAQLIVFPDCGHSPHIEKPTEFNDAVLKFLEAGEM